MRYRLHALLALCLTAPPAQPRTRVVEALDTALVPAGVSERSYPGRAISVGGGALVVSVPEHGVSPRLSARLFWGLRSDSIAVPFGNGLRCVGGPIQRAGVRSSSAEGKASRGSGPSTCVPAREIQPGDELAFQVGYRDLEAFCAQGFNLTSGSRAPFTS